MLFTFGYLQLGWWRGVPLRWHASLPVGIALMSGLELAPWRWLFAFVLILVHQAGHATMVRRRGLRVVCIDLQGIGGETRWRGPTGPDTEAALAWGGVLAQLAAYVAVRVGMIVLGEPSEGWASDLVYVMTDVNLIVCAVHLLPLPSFDGADAWRVLALGPGWTYGGERVMQAHVAEEPVSPEVEARVRTEVEAEVDAIARTHNERAASGR